MNKILIVEDDEALAMGLEFALTKEGFAPYRASTLKEALEAFNGNSSQTGFSLALLDVMLPDGNGFDLCKKIREKSDLPVIFLTACDEEVHVVLGLDIGADDYITKPFRVKELVSRIKAILRRTGNQKSETNETITSHGVTLDPMTARATKNGVDLPLTPVEYRLLAALIQNPFQTLTRNQLLEKLWDIEGEFVDDNTLSVNIRRLREKLEADPSNPEYIVTIRGIGYKWNQKNSG
ncbi:MAG TPA: response regulator transcription factor [Bacillota bacterium]|nr:response regulator transcription factor [Bacillota bacterium]